MPHYGSGAVQPLIDGFAQACGFEPGAGPPSPTGDGLQTRGSI
jgi:hypothetical protein